MNVELFPFGDVPKGARIAIYGYGNVGQQYELQVERTGYAQIVAIVDAKRDDWGTLPTSSLMNRETFFSLPRDAYDCLVIAISKRETAEAVAAEFIAAGVPAEKIVYPLQPSILQNADLDAQMGFVFPEEDIIAAPMDWVYFLNSLFLHAPQQWDVFPHIVEAVRACKGRKEELSAVFQRDMRARLSDKARMYLLRAMYDAECFDADCMRTWMHTLRDMVWDDDTPYYCVMNSDLPMAFVCPEAVYDGFYRDRQVLLQRVNRHYQLTLPAWTPKSHEARKRVMFIFYYFETYQALYELPKNYIRGFQKRGYECSVLVLGAWDSMDSSHYFMPVIEVPRIDDFEEQWYVFSDGSISAEYIRIEDVRTRLQEAVDAVFRYDPDFIVDFTDECFPEAELLQEWYPIIYMPFRKFASSGFFDTYVTGRKEDVLRTGIIPEEKIAVARLGNLPPKKDDAAYTRADIGCGEDDFVLVTVGFRLPVEIRPDFLAAVCAMMEAEPRMKWVLVEGTWPVVFTDPRTLALERAGRIIHRGMEEHIESLYRLCDVFLNPNRQGGGTSIRRAMVMGLPIAMTDFPSDNLQRMEGHVVHGGYPELMAYVRRLCHDAAFCASEGALMQSLMAKFSPQSDADQVLAICEETWRKRQEQRTKD